MKKSRILIIIVMVAIMVGANGVYALSENASSVEAKIKRCTIKKCPKIGYHKHKRCNKKSCTKTKIHRHKNSYYKGHKKNDGHKYHNSSSWKHSGGGHHGGHLSGHHGVHH